MTELRNDRAEHEPSFSSPEDQTLGAAFLRHGFVIVPAESETLLHRIRSFVAGAAARFLGQAAPADEEAFLNQVHEHLALERLNDLRLAVIQDMAQAEWLRPAYYQLAANALATITGNELAMQRRINLSVQLPGDESSLLPVHADAWSGDSPFEVVLWVPLVDCHRTKSMFIMPRPLEEPIHARLATYETDGVEGLFKALESDLTWIDIPCGKVLIFSQNLMHGNRVNQEAETRWSMNCRFKGLFTPYADKKLGEFFAPITLRPATRMGLDYHLPEGFHD